MTNPTDLRHIGRYGCGWSACNHRSLTLIVKENMLAAGFSVVSEEILGVPGV